MLSLFRTNHMFAGIMLLPYAVLLRLFVFISPPNWEPACTGYLSDLLYQFVGMDSDLNKILAILLITIQAFFLNYFIVNHRLTQEITLFPGLFYILVGSAIPEFFYLSPILIANTFVIFGVNEFFKVPDKYFAPKNIFNFGFWIGIGSLFYPPLLFFVLWGFAGLSFLKKLLLNELLIIVIGALVPYIFTGTYFFWHDQFSLFISIFLKDGFNLSGIGFGNFRYFFIAGLIFISFLIIVFNYNSFLLRLRILERKKIEMLAWTLLFSLAMFFMNHHFQLDNYFVFCLPIGILLSFYILRLKGATAEGFHFFLLLAILGSQYIPYFFN